MSLLSLLQLASPTLPIGAYSYSEGIEFLAYLGIINDSISLDRWLRHELNYGSIRIDCAILIRTFQSMETDSLDRVTFWNQWLTAQRETEELRLQSLQMGNALIKLLRDISDQEKLSFLGLESCNYAVAFAIVAYEWEITLVDAIVSFLFAWAVNLVSAGIRSIPIGQTAGQKILLNLHGEILGIIPNLLSLEDHELESCNIGLALASMGHEAQYSRLFRS